MTAFPGARVRWAAGVAVGLAVLVALPATAQVVDEPPVVTPDELAPSRALGAPAGTIIEGMSVLTGIRPEMGAATLTWIAIVLILVLTFQTRPLFCWRNLDGLVLACTCLLLLLRTEESVVAGDPSGKTVQWWSYLLLTLSCVYWLARGLKMMTAQKLRAIEANVSEGAMTILALAAIAVAFTAILTTPISDAARDGLVGGVYTAETGKLPYGDAIGHDGRSPLLYLLYAGAVKLAPPEYESGNNLVRLTWDNRDAWLADQPPPHVDRTAVRLVNAALFILLLGGLAAVGYRLHSVALGQTICAILCVFPGTLECVARPEIMLPAGLLTWSVALIGVPVFGSLLSLACALLAGLAWSWCWVVVPVLLGYYYSRGWNRGGSILGTLGGAAACLACAAFLVNPSLPRAGGAVRLAGQQPAYTATVDDGVLAIDRYGQDDQVPRTIRSWFWRMLLARESISLEDAALQATLPAGVDASQVLFRQLEATPEARSIVQDAYRKTIATAPPPVRFATGLRTLLEATWHPENPPPLHAGSWAYWSGGDEARQARWIWIRRGGKLLVMLFALFLMVYLARQKAVQPSQLIGGLLAIAALSLIVTPLGAVTNWVWLLPLVLAAMAVRTTAAPNASRPPPIGTLPSAEPAPRITIED